MDDIFDQRRGSCVSVDSLQDFQIQENGSPIRGVPKGSDEFQKTLVQLYDDMKTERERKKLCRQNGEDADDGDEYSDEERDKCTDIRKFRRFSQDFTAKQHFFMRNSSLHHVHNAQTNNSGKSKASTESLPIHGNRITSMKNKDAMARRHSIATIPYQN